MSVAGRALARLARPGACCAPEPQGRSWAVHAGQDLRRRATARFPSSQARAWLSDGTLAPGAPGRWILTDAGQARAARQAAAEGDAYRAQHRDRPDAAFADGPLLWLARLREPDGTASFTPVQLAAGERLHAAWLAAGAARIATSDWTRPSGTPGAGDRGTQARAAARLDAQGRLRRWLAAVGPDHARVLEMVCLRLCALSALERELAAPRGSGKVRVRAALQALAVAAGLTLR